MFKYAADIIRAVGTGYALMALALLIVGIALLTGKLDPTLTFALVIVIYFASLIAALILAKDQKSNATARSSQPQPTESEDEILKLQIVTFAEQSQLPIYLTNEKKIIEYCNPRLESLLGVQNGQIKGSPVTVIIKAFEQVVPLNRLDGFRKRQEKVLAEAETSKFARISELIDLKMRTSSVDKGSYWVSTQAELICTRDKRPIGIVVISHLQDIYVDHAGKVHFPELES